MRWPIQFVVLVLTALSFVTLASAQSITSGVVTGTVTDATGSSIPNASITLVNLNTNATQKTNSGTDGTYRFAFVPPGNYKVTVSVEGFQTSEQAGVAVVAGQPTTVNFQLPPATASQTISVAEAVSTLQIANTDVATTFNTAMVENLPNPGGDITYLAQTAPGVVMNAQAGYGNFVADGMPGISNLFSINGANFNDPFFGTNNSGASNLLLGSNDIAEAQIINNAYSAQYGQYAGSQVIYITKSGTNEFHGNAIYMWNGRALNANQFFSNSVGAPTPFNNFNQWQTFVSGPIWKNRTFFDVNYEGVRNVLPTASNLTLVPSPQFEAATLANLASNGNSAQLPFYRQIFGVYNNAPGVGSAVPVPGGGCGDFTGLGANAICALQFRTTPPNLNREYQWSARVDHTFNNSDRGYIRVLRDNGFQPTFTSPFGPIFNFESNQLQMSAQVSETHVFGPNTVNEFKGSTLYYSAVFTSPNEAASLAALPTFVGFAGNTFTPVGYGEPPFPPGFFFPQGHRVFQYQVVDDLSHIRGRHTFRIGISWLHSTVTDLDFQSLGGPIHGAISTNLTDFFNGGGVSTSLLQGSRRRPKKGSDSTHWEDTSPMIGRSPTG